MKPELKRVIFSWSLYDFANSAFTTLIVTFIYSTYFTQAIAANEIEGTVLWSRAIYISAIIVAILSPVLGAVADNRGYRKRFLILFTLLAVVGSVGLFSPLPGQIYRALGWFVFANIAFELSLVFYNAYLPGISSGKNIGRISGYGWSFGYVGGLLAMVIAMIGFINPESPWFGLSKESGENIRATNVLVAVWYLVFSIPVFIFLKDGNGRDDRKQKMIRTNLKQAYKAFAEIVKYRQVVRLLIARLIYNDGLITIFAFGGIYAAGTFGFSFQEIMIFGIVLNIAAGIGAFIMGYIDDRLGGKKSVQISLYALTLATLIALVAPNKTIFWIAGVIIGLFSGPNQSSSRSLIGRFIPANKENEFFGFFALSGKLTAFLGPLLLGLFTGWFQSQRAGIMIIAVFFIVGSLLLYTVNEKEGIEEAKTNPTDI